jgi:fatty acid desaturase
VRERHVSDYADLSRTVREAGLLERRRGYYVRLIALTIAAFAGVWALTVVLADSWWVLVPAVVLALVSAQLGFLGHDAAHKQMWTSGPANAWTARVVACLFAGLSYTWWAGKHNKHHNAPNQLGKDPDIANGAITFTAVDPATRSAPVRWLVARQGWFFFPLLTLEGLALHAASVQTLLSARGPWWRLELSAIAVRLLGGAAVVLWLLSPGKAVAFLLVQLAVFGVLLGGSFAPNHKGMPIVPPDAKIDFLRRQVLMSRNVTGGRVVDTMMGGLNYQVEHHLFPSLPRVNLPALQPLVRAHCAERGVPYVEMGLVQSYGVVVRYLNRVGLGERDPFVCPLRQATRG